MWNNLMGVCYQLADIDPGNGGFVCIPGSHKANFDMPEDVRTMEYGQGCYQHIPMKAGDALIFTEALTHGTLPWKATHERRTLLYRYAAGGFVNAKGMNRLEQYCPFYDELTPLQQAIMEPPYNANRADIAALLTEQERARPED
jgi:ectoine hydroxylase-related dioxygenase (phytanoyl-CoA dioxygenase family)